MSPYQYYISTAASLYVIYTAQLEDESQVATIAQGKG